MTGAVEIVSEPRSATFEESAEWYEYASAEHFWFQWRLAALRRLLADVGAPTDRPARVLDVGCGTGVLRSQLEASTDWTVDGADLNLPALEAAPSGRGALYYYDIEECREPWVASYDVVTLCDVIEHIENTRPFLEAATQHLKPDGLLIVNVPALPALHSAYDEAAGHLRRYTRATLAAECRELPLEVCETRYWGLSMVPLLALRKVWVRPGEANRAVLREGFEPPGATAHALLRAVMRAESRGLRRPPLGSSVLLAARRREATAEVY